MRRYLYWVLATVLLASRATAFENDVVYAEEFEDVGDQTEQQLLLTQGTKDDKTGALRGSVTAIGDVSVYSTTEQPGEVTSVIVPWKDETVKTPDAYTPEASTSKPEKETTGGGDHAAGGKLNTTDQSTPKVKQDQDSAGEKKDVAETKSSGDDTTSSTPSKKKEPEGAGATRDIKPKNDISEPLTPWPKKESGGEKTHIETRGDYPSEPSTIWPKRNEESGQHGDGEKHDGVETKPRDDYVRETFTLWPKKDTENGAYGVGTTHEAVESEEPAKDAETLWPKKHPNNAGEIADKKKKQETNSPSDYTAESKTLWPKKHTDGGVYHAGKKDDSAETKEFTDYSSENSTPKPEKDDDRDEYASGGNKDEKVSKPQNEYTSDPSTKYSMDGKSVEKDTKPLSDYNTTPWPKKNSKGGMHSSDEKEKHGADEPKTPSAYDLEPATLGIKKHSDDKEVGTHGEKDDIETKQLGNHATKPKKPSPKSEADGGGVYDEKEKRDTSKTKPQDGYTTGEYTATSNTGKEEENNKEVAYGVKKKDVDVPSSPKSKGDYTQEEVSAKPKKESGIGIYEHLKTTKDGVTAASAYGGDVVVPWSNGNPERPAEEIGEEYTTASVYGVALEEVVALNNGHSGPQQNSVKDESSISHELVNQRALVADEGEAGHSSIIDDMVPWNSHPVDARELFSEKPSNPRHQDDAFKDRRMAGEYMGAHVYDERAKLGANEANDAFVRWDQDDCDPCEVPTQPPTLSPRYPKNNDDYEEHLPRVDNSITSWKDIIDNLPSYAPTRTRKPTPEYFDEDTEVEDHSGKLVHCTKIIGNPGEEDDECPHYSDPCENPGEPTPPPSVTEEPTTKPEEPTEEPTTTPEEPTPAPEEPSEDPTTKPTEEPTTTPEEPTTRPDEPTTTPYEPTPTQTEMPTPAPTEPDEPTPAPTEPEEPSEEPTTKPEEPTEEPTATPEEPTTRPDEPTTTPYEPTPTQTEVPTPAPTEPDEPTPAPTEAKEPTEAPTTTPEEPTTKPDEPTTTPNETEEPTPAPTQPGDVYPEPTPAVTTTVGGTVYPSGATTSTTKPSASTGTGTNSSTSNTSTTSTGTSTTGISTGTTTGTSTGNTGYANNDGTGTTSTGTGATAADATTTDSTTSSEDTSSGDLSAGAIAGIVIAGAVVVAVVVGAVLFHQKSIARQREENLFADLSDTGGGALETDYAAM